LPFAACSGLPEIVGGLARGIGQTCFFVTFFQKKVKNTAIGNNNWKPIRGNPSNIGHQKKNRYRAGRRPFGAQSQHTAQPQGDTFEVLRRVSVARKPPLRG